MQSATPKAEVPSCRADMGKVRTCMLDPAIMLVKETAVSAHGNAEEAIVHEEDIIRLHG
ncbi:hypothetical protein [Legionella qingyii]|uniref:hypothetical protein n=1 Tax=Legionella qingyii TaxID=2184757 RepID=UPI0014039CD3|nr:hypothetical protein [Legionella qingyii]